MFGLFEAVKIVLENYSEHDYWKVWLGSALAGVVMAMFGIHYLDSVLSFGICILVTFAIIIEVSIRNMKRTGKW
jgi:hypothetical protein